MAPGDTPEAQPGGDSGEAHLPGSQAASTSAPRVAVVIPTHDRETRLAFALEALARQSAPSEDYEVIVVRDHDAEPPLAEAPAGLRVRFLASGSVDPTTKRNIGWRASRAPLIAFTDDDCRPHEAWIMHLLAAAEANPEAVLQGRTMPDPDEVHLLHGLARSIHVDAPSPWYETCNIAYPRELLERLDGFDEDFVFGGEDTDLGLRARKAGGRSIYVPEALSWHAVLPRPLPAAIRGAFRTHSDALVFARHPEQRREIYLGVFTREAHARLLLALAALLAARRAAAAALLALPYAAYHLDTQRTRPRDLLRQAVHLPARASLDLAEIAATITAALRYRVLVL